MQVKGSYCTYCGAPYAVGAGWPRMCPACGKRSYLNPLPVVVAVIPMGNGLVGVRRNIEPSRGLLTLPGGYLDCGETWQEAVSRELQEETGILVPAADFRLYDVANGIDDTIVILGITVRQPESLLQPFSSNETQEVVIIDRPMELGFPLHTRVAAEFFAKSAES